MSAISRATIPQEFLDFTSSVLLLQPEPEYLHAILALNAAKVRIDFGGNFGLPIPGRDISVSGVPGYPDLMSLMQSLAGTPDPVYSDAILVVPDFGKRPIGHTIKMNRPAFVDSTYTRASRRIPTGTSISKTPINAKSEQATVTIERYGGPYDNDNAQVQPIGMERFDAQFFLHNPNEIKDLQIVRDFRKSVDAWFVQMFNQGSFVYPTGMTAVNDSTVVGDFPMSYALITLVSKSMKEGKVPRFSNGRYMMIITPNQAQQLSVDDQYLRLVRYYEDVNPIFKKNYRGTIGDIDLFESVTLEVTNNGNGIPIHYAQCFGPRSVGLGMTEMPRTAPSTDDNYGETAIMIWLWYCGFDVLDSRFQRKIPTS